MKVLSIISTAALVRLSAAQSTSFLTTVVGSWPLPPSTAASLVASASSAAASDAPSKAICGQGFTYCGYILRDHQGNVSHAAPLMAHGLTHGRKTGFQQADIVKAYCAGNKDNCAEGKTKSDPLQALYVCLPGTKSLAQGISQHEYHAGNDMMGMMGGRLYQRQAPSPPAPTGGTCSTSPTTGNGIWLLCSCSSGNGTCLNPTDNHIGRCDTPCSG